MVIIIKLVRLSSFYSSPEIKQIELLHLFGKPNQNDLVIQGMHSNIKGNKMFFDSAERLKMKFHSLKRKRKNIKSDTKEYK